MVLGEKVKVLSLNAPQLGVEVVDIGARSVMEEEEGEEVAMGVAMTTAAEEG